MQKKAKLPSSAGDRQAQQAEASPRTGHSSGWVSVGDVRVTASEWDLLYRLITVPDLQTATNATLEQLRAGRRFSAVSTDIEELMSKGLLMVHGTVKEGRTIRPTGIALDAVLGRDQ
jgi:hypothetical protein